MAHLRLDQGVAAMLYLPHYAAQELGSFRDEGLAVELTTSFWGQQWLALQRGEADLSVGGPIRTMRLLARDGFRMVNFCAAVRANPWYLVGRRPEPEFTWTRLVGRTIIDFADAPTPGLCLRWVLRQQGVDPERVTMLPGTGMAREVETFRAGQGDYLLHSLHTALPLVAAGEAALVQELATPTGPVPWSSYATLPTTLEAKRSELEAFTRAITRALRWIAAHPAEEVAALVEQRFPDLTMPVLAEAVRRYRAPGLWPQDPLIARVDFEHFATLLLETGWLPHPVAYEDQVDTSIATRSLEAL